MQNGKSVKKQAKKESSKVIGRKYRFHEGRRGVANIINNNKHITGDENVSVSNIAPEILRNNPQTCQNYYMNSKHNASIAQRAARKIRLAADHLGFKENEIDFDLRKAVREKRASLPENAWEKESDAKPAIALVGAPKRKRSSEAVVQHEPKSLSQAFSSGSALNDFGQNLMVVMKQHHLFMEEERLYEERRQKRMLAQQASFQENLFKLMNMHE